MPTGLIKKKKKSLAKGISDLTTDPSRNYILQGPDYMVRVAKKSMLEELEAMLEVVDPQPQGSKFNLMRRCRFDLPEGPISDEMHSGVSNVVRIVEKEE